MSDLNEIEGDPTLGDAALVDGVPKKKINGKLIVIGAGGLVVLIILIIGLMSIFSSDEEVAQVDPVEGQINELAQNAAQAQKDAQQAANVPPEETKLLFLDVGEMQFNLNTDGEGTSFLRTKINLEIDRESFQQIILDKMPRVKDELNIYLRELRPADLNGGAGILLLKEELLMRINQAVAPARVKDVLFTDFIIQGSGG